MRGSNVFGTEGDPGYPSGGIAGWSIFGTEGGLQKDMEWRMLLDGLNDVEVSE